MKQISKILTTAISSVFLITTPVLASPGYSGGDSASFTYAADQAYSAKTCFDNAGYTTSYNVGSDYTKDSIKSEVPNVRVFYVSCHGKKDAQGFLTNNSNDTITPQQLATWTKGFYKFVFIDACHSGESRALYNAFKMRDDDGLSHAYLGWSGVAHDNSSYFNFSSKVFSNLSDGQTLNDAVWNAGFWSGVKNYVIYGDRSMKLN